MSTTATSCSIHGVPLSYHLILGTTLSQPFCPMCESQNAAAAPSKTTATWKLEPVQAIPAFSGWEFETLYRLVPIESGELSPDA